MLRPHLKPSNQRHLPYSSAYSASKRASAPVPPLPTPLPPPIPPHRLEGIPPPKPGKRHHAHLISATSSVDLREWTPLQSIRLKSVIACDASIPCFLRWLAVQSHPLPLVAFFPAVLGCEGSATARKAPTSSPIRDCAVACKSRQRRYSDSAPLAH